MPRPRRPWFRFYVEAVHDTKLRRLTPTQRWLWVAILAAARQSCLPGWLMVSIGDAMTAADLADFAAVPVKIVETTLPLFERSQMIVRDLDLGAWQVTNWNERQYESDDVTARSQRSRQRRSNVATTFPATPPETEVREQSSETDTTKSLGGLKVCVERGWTPNPESARWASERGYSAMQRLTQLERFIEHNIAAGTQFCDVDAAWRKWLSRDEPAPMDDDWGTDLVAVIDLEAS